MRKLFWQMMVTLDGHFEGPNGEIDWHVADDDGFMRYVQDMLQSIDGILLGRVTYEMFAAYWPTATSPEAAAMNALPKFVFSRTLAEAGWNNSRLIKDNAAEEVLKLKDRSGKDLALFGSADLGSDLLRRGVIDEIRVMVNPVTLGAGRPMFKGVGRAALRLDRTETLPSGVVILSYQPVK